MPRHAWKVSDLLLLVLSTAMAFGAFRYSFGAVSALVSAWLLETPRVSEAPADKATVADRS